MVVMLQWFVGDDGRPGAPRMTMSWPHNLRPRFRFKSSDGRVDPTALLQESSLRGRRIPAGIAGVMHPENSTPEWSGQLRLTIGPGCGYRLKVGPTGRKGNSIATSGPTFARTGPWRFAHLGGRQDGSSALLVISFARCGIL